MKWDCVFVCVLCAVAFIQPGLLDLWRMACHQTPPPPPPPPHIPSLSHGSIPTNPLCIDDGGRCDWPEMLYMYCHMIFLLWNLPTKQIVPSKTVTFLCIAFYGVCVTFYGVCVCVSSATCMYWFSERKKTTVWGMLFRHTCMHTHMYTGWTQTWDKVIFMSQLQLISHSTIILYKLQQWSWRKWKESTHLTHTYILYHISVWQHYKEISLQIKNLIAIWCC